MLGRSDVFAAFNAALVVAGAANDHSKRCAQGVCAARRCMSVQGRSAT